MIEAKNITKSYNNCVAIRGINLVIPRNQFIAITGESGSGKSTLMSLLSGLDTPTSGGVFIEGKDINHLSREELFLLRNKKFGFVFQQFFLEDRYSVLDNVMLPLLLRKKEEDIREKAIIALKEVGLEHKQNEKANVLSGGEQQRVAIARAVVTNPDIIFADEPCGNLDTKNGKVIMDFLKEMHNNGKTIVLVTHNVADAKMAERNIVLKDGEIIADELI